jgi:hypothetical protein
MYKRLLFTLVAVVSLSLFVLQPPAAAISSTALKSILNNTPFYGDDEVKQGCSTSSDSGDINLSGSDNIQKGFNYFVSKGLSDVQSAGIIGNFMQESGMNPKADQAGGPGLGIAQWSNPGRWNNLEKAAATQGTNPSDLSTQLNFVWMELNGTAPAGDYSAALSDLKNQTTVETATTSFELKYEAAGDPQMQNRIDFANAVIGKYGNGGGTPETAAVSGTSAACGSVGSVDCANFTQSASSLSQVRQNVVCLAQAELVKWQQGTMKPGTDFYTYSHGLDQEWCAYFASWIFNQAGYPLSSASGGVVGAVKGIRDIGESGGKFEYHPAGSYQPIPGDIVVYQNGWSHVNIVVSVNQNDDSLIVIGGNQDGPSTANTSSRVSQWNTKDFAGAHISGYVSPKE